MIEQTGIIILGSIPTLRPLFRKLMGRDSQHNHSSSRGTKVQSLHHPASARPEDPDALNLIDEKEGQINVSTSFSVQAADGAESV